MVIREKNWYNETKEKNLSLLFLIQCIMIKQQGHIRSVWMSVGVGFQPPTPVRSCITVPLLLDPLLQSHPC